MICFLILVHGRLSGPTLNENISFDSQTSLHNIHLEIPQISANPVLLLTDFFEKQSPALLTKSRRHCPRRQTAHARI